MINHLFVDTCYLVTTSLNEFGEHIETDSTEDFPCRFRYIISETEGQHQENTTSDALLHAPQEVGLTRGSIVKYINRNKVAEYYQVERITEARRGGSTIVSFLKCELKRRYE